VLAEALVTLFFAWNASRMLEDLETKRSIMLHCVKAHTHFYINSWGAYFNDCVIRIFRNGWIDCRDLFSVYNIA